LTTQYPGDNMLDNESLTFGENNPAINIFSIFKNQGSFFRKGGGIMT
jgi:hypothetical protein